MDVTSLYIYLPQEGEINTVCKAYEAFDKNDTLISINSPRGMLRLILQENSFQFNRRHYLQTQGTAMGTKVAGANVFMSVVESEIVSKSKIKPSSGKSTSTTCSPCGTQKERKQISLF